MNLGKLVVVLLVVGVDLSLERCNCSFRSTCDASELDMSGDCGCCCLGCLVVVLVVVGGRLVSTGGLKIIWAGARVVNETGSSPVVLPEAEFGGPTSIFM